MKRYALTSPKFEGQIIFGFDDDDIMIYYHNETDMTTIAHEWMQQHLPIKDEDIQPLAKLIQGSLELMPEDLSFNNFWDQYGKKINKSRCEDLYKKLSDAKKLQAILSIKHYDNYLQRITWNRSKADGETYLRKKMYETDWKNER